MTLFIAFLIGFLNSFNSFAAQTKSPVEFIKEFDLKKGDLIYSCHKEKYWVEGYFGANIILISKKREIPLNEIHHYGVAKDAPGRVKIGTLVNYDGQKSGLVIAHHADGSVLIEKSSKKSSDPWTNYVSRNTFFPVQIDKSERVIFIDPLKNRSNLEYEVINPSVPKIAIKSGDKIYYFKNRKREGTYLEMYTVIKILSDDSVQTDQGFLNVQKKLGKLAFVQNPPGQISFGDRVIVSNQLLIFCGVFADGDYLFKDVYDTYSRHSSESLIELGSLTEKYPK